MAVKLAELKSIVSTTLTNNGYDKKLHDNLFVTSILPSELKRRGLVKPVNGGLQIVKDVEYDYNPTVAVRGGRAQIPAQDYDFIAQVGFPWAMVTGSIVLWHEDRWLNKGAGRLIDFAGAQIKNMEKSFRKVMNEQYYADGSNVNNATGFYGLEKAIAATGNYGNILGTDGSFAALSRTSDDYAWFRANVESTNMAFEVEGDTGLRHLYNVCTQGDQTEQPNLIVMPQSIWEAFVASLTLQQRFEDANLAKLGFRNVMLNNAAVVWDINCPYVDQGASHYHGTIYVLNVNHLELSPDTECSEKLIESEWITGGGEGYLYDRKNFAWRGQMVCTNPRFQGKMTAKSVA